MFNTTRNDLTAKTTVQLAAMFNQVSRELTVLPPASTDAARAKSLLAMIERERACRVSPP